MAKKKSLIELVREIVRKGATNVEEVHRAIAQMPLKQLEKIDSLRGPVKKIEKVQNESIGAIYDLIRDINEQVAKLAREILAQAREARDTITKAAEKASGKASAKKKRPAKAKAKPKAKAKAKPKPKAKSAARKAPAAQPA